MSYLRAGLIAVVLLSIALTLPSKLIAQDTPPPSNDSPHESGAVTLPEGTVISIRIDDEVNSNKSHPGELFTGSVDPSVFIHKDVVIPRGTEAHIEMVGVKKGGHIHGKAKVELELLSLVLDGERADVQTQTVEKKRGALAAKARAEIKPGAEGAAEAAASSNPIGAVASGGIAAFKAAKIDIKRGTRVPFSLTMPFTFDPPPIPPPIDDLPSKTKKK